MDGLALLVALVAMPLVLMVVAHFYALAAQDRKTSYIVLVHAWVDVEEVVRDHARQKVTVVDVWKGSVKGYVGEMTMKSKSILEVDPRVASIEPRDLD